MNLGTYLKRNSLSQREFARRAGIDASTLCAFLAGRRRRLSAENAVRVERVTGGAVRFEDVWAPSVLHERRSA